MPITLNVQDFCFVGELAKHCDESKLLIAIDESINFDLQPLLCDLYTDVWDNWRSTEEPWKTLINGGTYTNCNDIQKTQLGLKRVLVYYAYSRYLMINGFNDTPNGMVQKTNNFSIPKPLKEVEMFSDKYRSMGYNAWKKVEDYLCNNRELFDNFNDSNCKSCGCGDICDSKTKVKGYGIKGSNISKW